MPVHLAIRQLSSHPLPLAQLSIQGKIFWCGLPPHSTSTPQGFSDFVTLAKKLGPVVVNVSSTRVRGRGRELFGPFGEEDTGDELFGVPDPGVVFASEASV